MADHVSPIELQKHLSGVDYPAGKADLIDRAKQQGAGDDVLQVLQQIPEREYDGPNAVSAEFSKHA
jgi:hypothetical protein